MYGLPKNVLLDQGWANFSVQGLHLKRILYSCRVLIVVMMGRWSDDSVC